MPHSNRGPAFQPAQGDATARRQFMTELVSLHVKFSILSCGMEGKSGLLGVEGDDSADRQPWGARRGETATYARLTIWV
jgi:hypothetical protein